jgi:cobalt/nickel transport system permease protein
MHISEGVLSAPVLIAGGAIAVAGLSIGLRKMDNKNIPKVAVLSSAFFVASLIHVPLGPVSVHLVLNGINGMLLGWLSFPSIFVALTLQAILFQFGGITTLGVNTVIMALPGVICFFLFSGCIRREKGFLPLVAAFSCGALSVFMSCVCVALALVSTEESFLVVAKLIVMAHLPVMVIEGIITLFCVMFLKKVRPELLGCAYGKD